MARPTTKEDLLAAAAAGYAKLQGVLEKMTPEQLDATFAFEDRDRTVRDVLVHLYEWHQMLLRWVTANRAGDPQPFLPAPYNWKTYGQLNVEVQQRAQDTPLAGARQQLDASHLAVRGLIETFSNDELFAKKQFDWTGGTTLGSYCVSVTSSHYDWALKKICRHLASA